MKRVLGAIAFVLLAGAAVYGAPVYSENWDFEDGTVGQPHPDWSAGTVQANAPFRGGVYPDGNRLYTADSTSAWHSLPQATNSFVFTAELYTDAGDINGFRNAGVGYRYAANGNTAWFQGKHVNWPVEMIFGDNHLPNPRPGASSEWADYQWQGGSGRTVFPSSGNYFMAEASTWELPASPEIELMIKYNTPDNPGTVEMYFRSLNYDNVRAPAGQWLKLGWRGYNSAWYEDFILGTDPGTGDIWAMNAIKLGGDSAWSQVAFDNVTFTSIPEPATLSLLLVGGLPLLRRRR